MFKLIGITVVLAVIQISESAPVYQFLPPREGYVPVYIRLGDTPLDEIYPELALAFHESNIRTRNVNDLDEQMVNDAESNDDLSESVEDVKEKDKITTQKDSSSEEEPKPQKPTKPFNNEPDSDVEVDKKDTNVEKESEENKEDTDSEEEPTTESSTSDSISSEETEDKVTKPKPNVSNESKSSEES